MEHSRIILGEKVYKELNPTSKEKYQTPTFLPDPYLLAYPQQLGDNQQLSPLPFYLSHLSHSFSIYPFTPPHTPSLGLDWLSDYCSNHNHIQPQPLCERRPKFEVVINLRTFVFVTSQYPDLC